MSKNPVFEHQTYERKDWGFMIARYDGVQQGSQLWEPNFPGRSTENVTGVIFETGLKIEEWFNI